MLEVQKLSKISYFKQFGPATLQWLAQRGRQVSLKEGEYVFIQGEQSEDLYIVEDGVVRVFRNIEDEKELIINFYYAGESVGETDILDGLSNSANAICHVHSSLIVIPRKSYLEMMKLFPESQMAIIKNLSSHMRGLTRRLLELGVGEVELRLAKIVYSLAHDANSSKMCSKTSSGDVTLNLSRKDLSSLVGARLETVIRAISRWKKDGIAKSSKRGLAINLNNLKDRIKKIVQSKAVK